MGRILILVAALIAGASGCGPSAHWVRNPGPEDNGLRYYRPKPYILLAPTVMNPDPDHGKTPDVATRDIIYKMSLCYLPDFSEEYSVHLRPGLGASKLSVSLENGWNLTSVNQDLDSKTSSNIEAVTGLIKAATPGGLFASPGARSKGIDNREAGPTPVPDAIVHGHEVPIGYYEAVLGRDPLDGSRRLLGFRYVGFLPIAPGPVDHSMGGGAERSGEGEGALYGLVFEHGSLIFQPLTVWSGSP